MLRYLILLTIFLSNLSAKEALQASHIAFASEKIPPTISASNSSIKMDGSRSIWSHYSLRWDCSSQSTLNFNTAIPWRDLSKKPLKSKLGSPVTNCFVVWVYNTSPLPDSSLKFQFFDNDKQVCHFDFKLNFSGWRTAWVSFDRDMTGKPSAPMDRFSITAPTLKKGHTLWIGDILPHALIDHRHQHGDYQVPFVRGANALKTGHWDPIMHWFDLRNQIDPQLAITAEHRKSFRTLRQRLTPAPGKVPSKKKLLSLRQRFSALKLTKKHGHLSGEHIYYLHNLVGAPDKSNRQVSGHNFADVTALMLDLARAHHAYRETEHSSDTQELAAMFCLISEHLLDQGFAAGSSLGTLHHFGYSARSWVPAVFLMQEPLEAAGLLERTAEALRWFHNSYRIIEPAGDYANMDYLNTMAPSDFLIHFIGQDNGAKVDRLLRYSRWLSATIYSSSPNDGGGIKPDGSLFHHKMHYHGYGLPALLNTTTKVIAPLDGTAFEISLPAFQKLKKASLAACWWGFPHSSFNACGRHPLTNSANDLAPLLTTLAKSKPATNEVDSELAATRLALFGGDANKLFGRAVEKKKIEGHRAFNHHSSGVHKWQDSSVQIKGFGEGIRWGETYKNDNRYGRYQSHGSIIILKNTQKHTSGFQQAGWDWSKTPGTTGLVMSAEKLEGSTSFYGYRPKQKTFPSAAVCLDNRYGAFLFQLDPTNDPQSLKLRKSVFSIDGLLVCLGSNLSSQARDTTLATTLFQTELADAAHPPQQLPQYHALIDPYGTGYYLADRQIPQFTQGSQHSLHNKTRQATLGNFATAWIEHGKRVKSASYHYHILLESGVEALKSWHEKMNSSSPPVIVRRQDKSAHIIKIPQKNLTAACYFTTYRATQAEELIQATSRSCLTLIRHDNNQSITLAVTDPDHPDIGKKPEPLTITLKGTWKLHNAKPISAEYHANTTTLQIPHARGLVQQLKLLKTPDK